MTDTKPCRVCGATITRREGLKSYEWALRSYCSRKCVWVVRKSGAKASSGACEVCAGPLPSRRLARLPWCSNPCKATWQAAHPKPKPTRAARGSSDEDAQPHVRFRSVLLPDGAPRKTWVDRTPGHIAVCCGHCQRRFPRRTIRLAERLLNLHRRTCGSGL